MCSHSNATAEATEKKQGGCCCGSSSGASKSAAPESEKPVVQKTGDAETVGDQSKGCCGGH